ncbi:Membrane protein insertase YidC [Methylocella tundrae]|uniref:Membrane protein insertase YidC n=1 Tax=Methylocella tundrae TaxID=227605 RepID=A0A4U8Z547_METTU|nr:membrane protein insertase YidC [Methylocella tundrae]VFU10387.1 Membrane protein insertase YidC [Methylocella tundrae]
MTKDSRNLYLAIGLSCLVIVGWSYFFAPKPDRARQFAQQQAQTAPGAAPSSSPSAAGAPQDAVSRDLSALDAAAPQTRAEALADSPRVKIETPAIFGSLALKGARIDDVALKAYRETVDPDSPNIVLLSPPGAPDAYYAEAGFLSDAGAALALPRADTLWRADRDTLTPQTPVTLSYDNGEGLVFHRQIAVDERYMFTIRDSVENKSDKPVTLAPYALVARHGLPKTVNYSVLHEGFVGVIGDGGVEEIKYDKIEKEDHAAKTLSGVGGWLGFTDKYWAAAVIPDQKETIEARFSAGLTGPIKSYRADFVGPAQVISPGASSEATSRLFAGAKEVHTLDAYQADLGIKKFELLIDWGWFYFITRPMFQLLHFLYTLTGNFGVAILIATVIVKGLFFPLASKSYLSMAKMKAVAPQIAAIRDKYPEDKMKQQQETMALYKREKINPVSGCLPMLIQIPVFFALYKVLFVTIEMRHAPFFGWIKDLSAPDPTNIFNLFGLLPFDPTQIPMIGHFLALGVWPLIMGVTMFVQMKANPEPADPTQKQIFTWMPVIFTFTLGGFPSGLVIYWAWNNTLSVAQQTLIMKRAGVKIELFDNIAGMFRKKATS